MSKSEKPGRIEPPRGKVTYCVPCKDFTETILYKVAGPIPLFSNIGSSTRRVCVACGKVKVETKLETEEDEPVFPKGRGKGY